MVRRRKGGGGGGEKKRRKREKERKRSERNKCDAAFVWVWCCSNNEQISFSSQACLKKIRWDSEKAKRREREEEEGKRKREEREEIDGEDTYLKVGGPAA
jgi:hypothetical protein